MDTDENDRDNFLEKTRVRKDRKGKSRVHSNMDGDGVREIYRREPKHRWANIGDDDFDEDELDE